MGHLIVDDWQNFMSIGSVVLMISYCGLALPILKNKSILIKIYFVLILCLFCLFMQIYHGFNIVKIIRGVIGDLSITCVTILILLIIQNIFNLELIVFKRNTLLLIFVCGAVLYLSTFAIIPVDLYSSGYSKYALIGFIIFELYFLYANRVFAWVWLVALIGFYFKLQESVNLWDYLIDPILYLIVFCQIIKGYEIKKVN